MITIFSLIILLSIMNFVTSKNPVKLTMIIMTLTVSAFSLMAYSTGKTWYPHILTMLFLGGVLIMFLILSSLMPSEKEKKKKNYIMFLISLGTLISSSTPSMHLSCVDMFAYNKWLLTSLTTFGMILCIMVLYFYGFITILMDQKNPMRTTLYFKKFLLLKSNKK